MTRLSAPTFPSFGKRLKRQRAALGLKQEALAVALGVSQTTVSLWQFATEEIQQAEADLDGKGWWDDIAPAPQRLITSGAIYPELRISPGGMIWERMYLADGRPVRLTTGF